MFNSKILTDNGVNLEKSLELFGDMNTYNETLSDFLSDVENKLADIKKYKEAADMANYAILVHSLKSDARYFGFEMLADMAYNHEMESKANNMYYVYEHYDELMTEAKKILSIVKKYLGVQIGDAEEKEEVIVKDKTVLVVDDSNIIANFVTSILGSNYGVVVAKDGAEAIDKLSNLTNEIVGMLLDLNMPNVNGYEVLKFMQVNNIFKDINVAIITGTDSKEVLENVKGYPVVAILEKPFNENNVKAVVEMLIKK